MDTARPARGRDQLGRGRPHPGLGARSDQIEQLEEQELLDNDASRSPLRRGSGFVIGPYFQYRTWGIGGAPLGTGYGVGGSFRQAVGGFSTIMLDLGFASYSTNAGQTSATALGTFSLGEQRAGFDMTLAYEARIRFDARCTNALTIALGGELTDLVYAPRAATRSLQRSGPRGGSGCGTCSGRRSGWRSRSTWRSRSWESGSALTAATGASTLWQTTVMGGYAGVDAQGFEGRRSAPGRPWLSRTPACRVGSLRFEESRGMPQARGSPHRNAGSAGRAGDEVVSGLQPTVTNRTRPWWAAAQVERDLQRGVRGMQRGSAAVRRSVSWWTRT